MAKATCPVCGKSFEKDEPWKKTCLSCWRKKKNAEGGSSSGAPDELRNLRAEVGYLRLALTSIHPQTIEPDMLARLIRLCHPDKHDNSEMSTKATAWLLEQRA